MTNLLVFTCLLATISLGTGFSTDENRLTKYLIENYQRIGTMGRPVAKDSDPWNVTFHISLQNILEVHPASDTIEVVMWPVISWQDVFLNWDKADFKVDNIRVRPHDIMMPDITLYNAVSPAEPLGPAHVVVYPGGCMHVPNLKQRFSCAISDSDEFTCDLKFGSWTYSEDRINLTLGMDHVDLAYYQPNKAWKIVKTVATRNVKHYPCCPEAYVDLTFSITLKKQ